MKIIQGLLVFWGVGFWIVAHAWAQCPWPLQMEQILF